MTDKRSLVDPAIDAGSNLDWITPVYTAARNTIEDGVSFTVLSYNWYDLKWELQNRSIPYWGETMRWINGEYWTTFSVHTTNGLLVCNLASNRSANGRGKAIVLLLIAGAILAIILTLLSSIVRSGL